jgi:hypothetical protein
VIGWACCTCGSASRMTMEGACRGCLEGEPLTVFAC